MAKKERDFQGSLIKEIQERLPNSIIMKNDANYKQGIPDLVVYNGSHWGMLECKKSAHESFQPNQKYYLDILDGMSFARAIYPENKEEVLDDLQRSLEA